MKTFTFNFYNEETELSTLFWCDVVLNPLSPITWSDMIEMTSLYDFGEINACFNKNPYNKDECVFGLCSEKIEPVNYQSVFDKWLNFFRDKGITISNTTYIEEIHNNETTI